MKFLVETSARHLHVTQQDLEKLFGAGHQLTPKRNCPSPGSMPPRKRSPWLAPRAS